MLLNAGHGRLRYELIGPEAGPVACFLHCLSCDFGVWSEQVPPLLAAGWQVLRLDMRGHGGSDPGPGGFTMADLAADAVRVLDFLGFAKVHLIGLSIGGMIAQTFALNHRERLHSLMLCGTSPAGVPGGKEMWDERFAAMDEAGSLEPLADATMERWFTDAFKIRRPSRWGQIRETVVRTSLDGYRAGGLAIEGFDVAAQLPSITTPTLVVWGDGDTGTPPAGNRKIAELIPGARSIELDNARHVPNVEYPEVFNPILLDWLESKR
ncbi:MAG: alpha/beta fold hydrolase [Novosphingobium sp.]|nr:alpha/beta fold hydrolase [Novosphingobium sp.]